MMDISGSYVFRDYETDGIPSSGNHNIKKSEARQWTRRIESTLTAIAAGGGKLYASLASLTSDVTATANTPAIVIGDPTVANNGLYMKQGSSGSGSWVRVGNVPGSQFQAVENLNAVSPNAIAARSALPLSSDVLVMLPIKADNTSSPVTVSFNGAPPLTIKSNTGNDIVAGGLQVGMVLFGVIIGSTFRVLNDQVSAAIVAAAEAAAARAELAAATFTKASEAEATAGTNDVKYMTAAKVKKALESTSVLMDAMDAAHPETLNAIISRHGITPYNVGAYAGMADATAKINEAIDRVLTAGEGILWMPDGWNISGQLSFYKTGVSRLNMKMLGVGKAILINSSLTNQIALRIGDGMNEVRDIEIGEIFFNHSGARSQFDIACYKLSEAKFGHIKTDRSWGGIYAEDLNFCEFETININAPSTGSVTGTGVYIKSDPSGSGRTDNVRMKEVNIQAKGRGMNGLTLDGRVNGVITDRFYALGVARGCQLISSGSGAGNVPSFTELANFQVDRASDASMVIDKAYCTHLLVPDLSNTSELAGGTDGTTCQINADAVDTNIVGGRIGNSQISALYFAGKGLRVTGGCSLMDISKSGIGARPIMEIAPTARDFYVAGNRFEGFGRANYAVALASAAAQGWIRDNSYSGVVTGFSSGTGTDVDIAQNKATTHY